MNLSRLAVAMDMAVDPDSRYRRLQRFFQGVHFDYDAIAQLIMDMFGFEGGPFYLTLDRTNWKLGKKNLNILTLAIAYKGTAIPVYWLILNKQGNSNQSERMALLGRFVSRFSSAPVKALLADREFIGERWWSWLNDNYLPFLIRVRENQSYLTPQGKTRPVSHLFRSLKPGQSSVLRKPRYMKKHPIYLSGLRLSTGELLILAGNQRQSKPFEAYSRRWEIETLFQALKGRGFDMERTRLTRYHRIKKMVALLAIGFCWAHKTGEWKHRVIKPLRVKSHGRLANSLFRYGLDYLADKLSGHTLTARDSAQLLVLFWSPPHWIMTRKWGAEMIETPYKSVARL